MNTKSKSNSVLENLPEEDRQRVLFWLETHSYAKTMALVAAPQPEGLGIKTYVNSLFRFYHHHRRDQHSQTVEMASEFARQQTDSPVFDQATSAALRQAAFELAAAPALNVRQFKTISRWVLKLKDQELDAQHLQLETKKFEFNAARQALIHHAGLEEIIQNTTTDDQDKIQAARERIFGPAVVPATAV